MAIPSIPHISIVCWKVSKSFQSFNGKQLTRIKPIHWFACQSMSQSSLVSACHMSRFFPLLRSAPTHCQLQLRESPHPTLEVLPGRIFDGLIKHKHIITTKMSAKSERNPMIFPWKVSLCQSSSFTFTVAMVVQISQKWRWRTIQMYAM